MANYQNLKAAISAAIRTNGNQEITGQVLQNVLNSIVSVIGANYTFAGVATPATNPGTPDQNVMYLAMEGGTYTNFNGTVLPAGISLLMWNGSWTSETVMYGDGGVFDISVYKSSGGTLATFADLAAALDGGNNIPAAARKGGMSVKFVQSSDYVQYRLMSQTFSTTESDWQGVDDEPTAESDNFVKSGGIKKDILLNQFSINGNGSTFVWGSQIDVIAGKKYIVDILNPDIDMTGITGDTSILCINDDNNFTSPYVQVSYLDGFRNMYSFVPMTNKISIGCRCAVGSVLLFSLKESVNLDTYTNNAELNGFIKNLFIPKDIYNSVVRGDAMTIEIYRAYNNGTKYLNGCLISLGTREILITDEFATSSEAEAQFNKIITNKDGCRILISDTAYIGRSVFLNILISRNVISIDENASIKKDNSIRITGAGSTFKHVDAYKVPGNYHFHFNSAFSYTSAGTSNILWVQYYDGSTYKELVSFTGSTGVEDFNVYIPRVGTGDTKIRINIRADVDNVVDISINPFIDAGKFTDNYNVNSVIPELYINPSIDISNVAYISVYNNFVLDSTYVSGIRLFDESKALIVDLTSSRSVDCSYKDIAGSDDKGYVLLDKINLSGITYKQYPCMINNKKVHDINSCPIIKGKISKNKRTYYIAASNSSEFHKSIADYVCTGTSDENVINPLISESSTIYLLEGTYTLSSNNWIKVMFSGVSIIGIGDVVISRAGSIITDGTNISDLYIENIVTTNGYITPYTQSGTKNSRVVKCSDSFGMINDYTYCNGSNIIEVGSQKNIENFMQAYDLGLRLITSNNIYTPNNITLHIYGKHVINRSSALTINRTISFVGMTHDAEVEVALDAFDHGFLFTDTNTFGDILVKNKDITFTVSGEFPGYQQAAVQVQAKKAKFYNCVFKNITSCADAYIPENDTALLTSGDRRHGILVRLGGVFDEECNTEFHECTAMGSPYGFKNTRGWYILEGSPKLYNCIGIGGGIGKNGHGILNHATSKAYLYNCVGYGSPYGYEYCNGFQFQYTSTTILENCVGYGGCGYQHESSGGTNITKRNVLTGASHGICFHENTKNRLINCCGYAGDGDGSCGLYSISKSAPKVLGGIFGKDLKNFFVPYAVTSGQTYMILDTFPNDNRPVRIINAAFRDASGVNRSLVNKFIIKTSTGTIIGQSWSQSTSGEFVLQNNGVVLANAILECHVVDANGEDISSGVSFNLFIKYLVHNEMCCVSLHDNAYPYITDAVLECNYNSNSKGIIADSNSDEYVITDCKIIIPSTNPFVSCSQEKSQVRVVSCKTSSALTENVQSFIEPSQVGTNDIVPTTELY